MLMCVRVCMYVCMCVYVYVCMYLIVVEHYDTAMFHIVHSLKCV